MARDAGPESTTSTRGETDGLASSDATAAGRDVLEVRVVALGAGDGTRWLAMGRSADGASVTFVTDRRAAERIADAMAGGDEPVVVIERRQLV